MDVTCVKINDTKVTNTLSGERVKSTNGNSDERMWKPHNTIMVCHSTNNKLLPIKLYLKWRLIRYLIMLKVWLRLLNTVSVVNRFWQKQKLSIGI